MPDLHAALSVGVFFAHVRGSIFHGLTEGQITGCNAIMDTWEAHELKGDLRHLAYMLATTEWETGHTMMPVEEMGHGRGHAYGVPTGPWHEVYYGRGDVQETWIYNYRTATIKLRARGVIGADIDLVRNPELMLRPDIAAATLIFGMLEGWFTGRKLADYIHDTHADWFNARRVVNGTDQAEHIAGVALKFNAALHAAVTPSVT